jgi:hypothetical protein
MLIRKRQMTMKSLSFCFTVKHTTHKLASTATTMSV